MLELLVFGCLLERLAQYINDECTPLMLIRNEINGWILCARVCYTPTRIILGNLNETMLEGLL